MKNLSLKSSTSNKTKYFLTKHFVEKYYIIEIYILGHSLQGKL